MYEGAGTGGTSIASREFKPSGRGLAEADFTGTGLTVGSTYTAAMFSTSPYFAFLTLGGYDGGQIYAPGDLQGAFNVAPQYIDLAFRVVGTTVSPVPEPATWALMLAGFGLVGATMRRRRSAVHVTYA